jgi:hypothetical protein
VIKTITAFTDELDDSKGAIEELVSQVNPTAELLSNSVGIITCYSEYVDEGIINGISEIFDFPIVGATTIATCINGDMGINMLTLTVLTSDDVEFSVELTDPVINNDASIIDKAYQGAMNGYNDKPSLIFTFAPLSHTVGGDFMVNTLDEISGGVPTFGTIVVDHNSDYKDAAVIFNGKAYKDRMALILFHGEVNPKFVLASISKEVIMKGDDVVTASKGNQLETVNGMSVVDYLLSLGMTKNDDGEIEGINSIPFVVDYGDNSQPVTRILFALTEDGSAVCGGEIPVGTKLSVGTINYDEVINTSSKAVETINLSDDGKGAIIFSCVGRLFSLGFNTDDEMKVLSEKVNKGISYNFAYSGGEICPTSGNDGKLYNRFHNDTFVACIL